MSYIQIVKKNQALQQLEEELEASKLSAENLGVSSVKKRIAKRAQQEQQPNISKDIMTLANSALGLAAYRGLDLIEFMQGRISRLEECSEPVECTKELGICYCGCLESKNMSKIEQIRGKIGLRKENAAQQENSARAGGRQRGVAEHY